MMLITYRGRAVAMAGADRFYVAPLVDMRPSGDPLKTFVCFLALYARDVQSGALPGKTWHYLPRIGERYAREALIPARSFASIQHHSDRELAAQFNVPIEQIARRRNDLAGGGYRNVRRDRPQLCVGSAESWQIPAHGAIRCGLD